MGAQNLGQLAVRAWCNVLNRGKQRQPLGLAVKELTEELDFGNVGHQPSLAVVAGPRRALHATAHEHHQVVDKKASLVEELLAKEHEFVGSVFVFEHKTAHFASGSGHAHLGVGDDARDDKVA